MDIKKIVYEHCGFLTDSVKDTLIMFLLSETFTTEEAVLEEVNGYLHTFIDESVEYM